MATPRTGLDSIFATYSLLGLPFAIIRPFVAFFTALIGGQAVNLFNKETSTATTHTEQREYSEQHHSFVEKIVEALRYGFVEMMGDIGKWLVIGLIIAGLITTFVPQEFFAVFADNSFMSILLVFCISIPMYVCATGSIPIAVALMLKGLTPGAALVLLMAGPAANAASILIINKVLGRKTLIIYLSAIALGAIGFGLGIDYLLPQEWFSVQAGFATMGDECTHGLSMMEWVWIAVLAVLLANAFWQAHHGHGCCCENEGHGNHEAHESHEPHKHHGQVKYSVHGMSCNHCKANVERAIRSVEGVEDVEVSLVDGEAIVVGPHDTEELINQLKSYGYEASRMK
jgi:copper chaperone CopZ